MGGQVQVYFSPLPESISNIKGGKVRALAVTTAKRSEALPDVPAIGESVPGFEANTLRHRRAQRRARRSRRHAQQRK